MVFPTQFWNLIGTPTLIGGGLILSSSLSFFGLAPWSSMLVSRCKKLASLTGLPLWPPSSGPLFPLPLPLPLLVGPGEVKCGIFSGSGCSEPMDVTPPSGILPAFERA